MKGQKGQGTELMGKDNVPKPEVGPRHEWSERKQVLPDSYAALKAAHLNVSQRMLGVWRERKEPSTASSPGCCGLGALSHHVSHGHGFAIVKLYLEKQLMGYLAWWL